MTANAAYYKGAVNNICASVDGTPLSDPYSRSEVSDFFSDGVVKPDTAIVAVHENAG
jgi:hypothetical protein